MQLYVYITIAYILALSNATIAQPPSLKFEYLTTTDGLSHNKVQCILQDKQGYLWFGTIYGLNRYDGYTFKVFQNIPGDTLSIANNNVISLYQDKDDIIWIGTSTVLCSFNPKTESFYNYDLPSFPGWVYDFEEDDKGFVWLATASGLFSFDKKGKEKAVYHKTDDSSRDNIQSILKCRDKDCYWLGTETGIRKFNIKTGEVKNYKVPSPAFNDISREISHNLIEDKFGNVWMTTSDLGVYKLNPQSGEITSHAINGLDPSSSKSRVTTQIMEDVDGKMWICGEGLGLLDPVTNSLSFYKIDISGFESTQTKIRSALKDKSGIYWFGTERGIAKHDPKLYSFTTIKPNYPFTLQATNTLIEDNDHNFWVGNYGGLGLLDRATGFYTNKTKILGTSKSILYSSAMDKNGSMWFGSTSSIFNVSKRNNSKQIVYDSEQILLPVKQQFAVTSLAFDPGGILWIGTRRGGLFSYNPTSKTFKIYKGEELDPYMFSATTISALHANSADSLLIGTQGSGLILMHTKTVKLEKVKFKKGEGATSIDYSIINCICEDHKRNIWVGTENGGLWETNMLLTNFKHFTVSDGLQSMNIKQIVEDAEGQIWLNNNIGLDIIDPGKKRVANFSDKDGLSNFLEDYFVKTSSGDLILIDFNGLHIFQPSSISRNKDVPPVYIHQIKILDKTKIIYNDTTIKLRHNQNYLSFDFVALNYTQSFKNRYAYRLKGLDENWINTGERRFASYANINPGTYTFQVKASNNNGVWNEKPAQLTIIISPHWSQTWWFYSLCIVAIAVGVYIIFQYRLKQKLKAYEVRNSISQDLHDEVGSTLSSIGFLSSMALNETEGYNPKAISTLSSISESANKMLDAMNDIIWNIQPQNDTLENIISRMISFASELLESRKISLHFHIAENIKHMQLGIAVRHDFFVIYKEAVNNLAKYSCASEAHISLDLIHPYLVLTIADNGKGFDPKNQKNGNGLKNMQNRAKKINAIYRLHSVIGGGTTIQLHVKPT